MQGEGQAEPEPTIPDSILNKEKHPIEEQSWRLLTYTKGGEAQGLEGSDSVSITLDFKYGTAKGSSGCNDFKINYTIGEGGQLTFDDNTFAHSSRICKGLLTQERFVQELLRSSKSFELLSDNRQLDLIAPNGKLTYIRVAK